MISVLIPLTDPRGDSAGHIATWTNEQTLPRDRYQVVIVSAGENLAEEREVAGLLASQDVLERFPGAGLVELWNHAARLATGPWLLFTENHCQGDPGCLAAIARALEGKPDVDTLSLEIGNIGKGPHQQAAARWFDHIHAGWAEPGQWTRLSLAGFVIHRDTFERAGPFEPRYELFCSPLLAARLNDEGARMELAEGARVLHVHNDTIQVHHEHTAHFAHGECEARASEDPLLCDRYFGPARVLRNRQRYRAELARPTMGVLASSAARALLRNRQELGWLAREIGRTLPAAMGGIRPYVAWENALFRWSEWAAMNLPLSPEGRWHSYLRAHARVVRLTHLRWVDAHPEHPRIPAPVDGGRPVEELDEHALIGVDGMERDGERWFRWTDPVALLRLPRPGGDSVVRIDTGGLRGSPLHYVRGVYVDGRRVPPSSLRDEDGVLAFPLPGGSREAPVTVTLLSRPLEQSKVDPGDARRLGMPLFSVAVQAQSPDHSSTQTSLATA
jgi:hypothetical protein